MKRTPLVTETKPRTPGSVGVTYLSSPPKPAEGTIGDIVVDVFTGTYSIKTDTGWSSSMSTGLMDAIDASTLRIKHTAGNTGIGPAAIGKAHSLIHAEMKASRIGACHRSGTTLTPGWAR